MDTASQILKKQNILKLATYLNLAAYLWPQPTIVKDNERFDFIVIGGGTAGSIVAGNLANKEMNVLLIEAGDMAPAETELAQLFVLLVNTDYDWNFTSVRNETAMRYHKGEVTQMHSGKLLGGSGQINFMLYGQGHPQDYAEWANITNDSSWTYQELCPLIKRTEKVVSDEILHSPDAFFHGTQGKVAIKKYSSNINKGFYDAYEELGYEVLNDINPKSPIGFSNAYFTINGGVRQSTAYGYLRPEKENPHLKVIYNSLATKIIFDGNKRAIGVKVLTKEKKLLTVKADKEIIVTAGTIKSAQLLMLSGIGPMKHLKEKGIKVISDLPVGQNFQDHPTNIVLHKMEKAKPFKPVSPLEFPVEVIEGRVAVDKCQNRANYLLLSGLLTDPKYFLEVCGFVFSFKDELCLRLYKKMQDRQIHYVTHHLLYAESRGEVLLRSTNPEDHPIVDPKYYYNERDLERHAKYLEHYNAILNTSYYRSVKAELVDPELETCTGLKRYSFEYWKCYAKGMSTTLHNYGGTCAMGSVVDSKLRVKGVKNLWVGDASIIPILVGSTIQGTVMTIAQKLSDTLIKLHRVPS